MKRSVFLAVIAILALAIGGQALAQTTGAYAVLKDKDGKTVGTATLTQTAAGVQVAISAQGLTPGAHGFHVHAVGTCTPPDFTSAGGHFNPDGKQHGLQNPAGAHVGDMPNLVADAAGKASATAVAQRATLAAGATSLFDADGSAIVIHANADDDKTDPTGNAGGRVACGVVTAGQLPSTSTAPASLPLTGIAAAAAAIAAAALAVALRRRQVSP